MAPGPCDKLKASLHRCFWQPITFMGCFVICFKVAGVQDLTQVGVGQFWSFVQNNLCRISCYVLDRLLYCRFGFQKTSPKQCKSII